MNDICPVFFSQESSNTADLKEEEVRRYARQLLLPEVGPKGQKALKRARVLIVGAGGLGSPAALYLAAAGIGTLGIADKDQVELSNLNRQILHHSESIGQLKVQSASESLKKFNPQIEIIQIIDYLTTENVNKLIKDWDIIVDGTDNFQTKFILNDACVSSGRPLIHAGVSGWKGQVLTILPEGPCLRCMMPNEPLPEDVATCIESGILGSIAGIVGSIQATEAVKVLLNLGKPLSDRYLSIDGLSMSFRELKIKKNPSCPVCG